MNRLVLGGEDVTARLCLPRRIFDLLIEQVRYRRTLCCIHQLLLRLGQVSREVLDAALFEPHAPVRHFDVRKHRGRWELVKLALRGLVGIRREGRDIDEPGHTWIGAGMRDERPTIGVADEDRRAADPDAFTAATSVASESRPCWDAITSW